MRRNKSPVSCLGLKFGGSILTCRQVNYIQKSMEIEDKLGGVCSPRVLWITMFPSERLHTWWFGHPENWRHLFWDLGIWSARISGDTTIAFINQSPWKTSGKQKNMKKKLHFRAMSHESLCKTKLFTNLTIATVFVSQLSGVLHLQFSHGRSIDITLFRGIDADTWDLSITNRRQFEADRGKILESSFWHL